MRIAFWGLGSIAKRHIKNLASILSRRGVAYQIDVFRHSGREIREEEICALISNVYDDNSLEGKYYDIIFITNPTALHYETIKRCIPYTRHIFIEKPVFEKWDEDIQGLHCSASAVYYVACPLRYTAVLQYIKSNLEPESVFSVRAVSSSYLPDWRPGVDYRDTYSAHRKLGGGVAIDLIHEWDYLTALFGFPEQVYYAGGKYSALDIDSDDLAAYIGVYRNRIVELHLDYFGRQTVREAVFYTSEDVIAADLVSNQVCYMRSGKTIDLTEERDAFQKRELEHFFDIIEGKCENDSTIEHAVEVLKIAQNIGRGAGI